MNILQILPELNVGGVETGTVDFAKYLVAHGHKSVVVSAGGTLVDELEKGKTKHYTLPVHKKSLISIIHLIGALRKIIMQEEIDIVHARSRVPGWISYFACRKTKSSFVTTCHGYYQSRIFSQIMGWAKLVIVPSEIIGRHMIDDFKVSSQSIRCIPRSVDLDKFKKIKKRKHEHKGNFTIAMIGRITPLKGHIYFIKAMAGVIRRIPYAKIWIIGDAPVKKELYKRELEMLVKRLGLAENFEFLGARKDIPELLEKTDVLVLATTTQEAFGRVILEAQAAGVPVVATKVGGVVDIIDDEKTGLLVMPKDTEAMAKAVCRLFKDQKFSRNLVREAKKKLQEKYTLDHMAQKTLGVYEELLSSINILVVKISSLGDVVLITASLKAIREKYPNAKITCLVGKESRKILQNCPYLDGIIIYDYKNKDKGWLNFFKLSQKLRKYRFDKVIDFQNNRKSHLFSYLSFPKSSYGYNNGKWGFLLSNQVKNPQNDIPAVDHQFKILNMLDIQQKKDVCLELWPSKKDKRYVEGLLQSEWLSVKSKMVGINIAASEKWKTKRWPLEYIVRFCDILSNKNIRVVMVGEDKDKCLVEEIVSMTKSKPAIFVGKTDIMQLAVLIKMCQVFVSLDSAPMHIAAAMEVPLVALFGPTDAERHRPPAKQIVVLDKKLECAPCYSPFCKILTHACMKAITPEDVILNVEKIISRSRKLSKR